MWSPGSSGRQCNCRNRSSISAFRREILKYIDKLRHSWAVARLMSPNLQFCNPQMSIPCHPKLAGDSHLQGYILGALQMQSIPPKTSMSCSCRAVADIMPRNKMPGKHNVKSDQERNVGRTCAPYPGRARPSRPVLPPSTRRCPP